MPQKMLCLHWETSALESSTFPRKQFQSERYYPIRRILCIWWRFFGLYLLVPHNFEMISPWFSFCLKLADKRMIAASPVYGLWHLESRDDAFGRGGHIAVNSKVSRTFHSFPFIWLWVRLVCPCFLLCSLRYLCLKKASLMKFPCPK